MTEYFLEKLLSNLKNELNKEPKDICQLIKCVQDLLLWLCENNTAKNCSTVDREVFLIISNADIDSLPLDLKEILGDIGGILHDTHENPEIAENFFSTPPQLLRRIREIADSKQQGINKNNNNIRTQ